MLEEKNVFDKKKKKKGISSKMFALTKILNFSKQEDF